MTPPGRSGRTSPRIKESAMGKGNNSQKNDKKNKKPKKEVKKPEAKPAFKSQ